MDKFFIFLNLKMIIYFQNLLIKVIKQLKKSKFEKMTKIWVFYIN